MPTADEQVIVDGQRALAVSEVSGDFIYDGGATDIYCIVEKDGKAQRALKVANVGEGGGGGGDVPDNVYTQDNLVAGTNISITAVPQPVIDANTVELYHCNGDMIDVISNHEWTTSANQNKYSYPEGKFAQGVRKTQAYDDAGNPLNSFDYNVPATIDFWICRIDTSVYMGFKTVGGGDWNFYGTYVRANNTTINYPSGITLGVNEWHHIAIVNDGLGQSTSEKYYIDGKLAGSKANYGSFGLNAIGQGGIVDEIRVSNVARWTSDFTPFSQPYKEDSGDPVYQINNTQDLSSYLKNTATGTNALTLLGTATNAETAINIGKDSKATQRENLAIGHASKATGALSFAFGAGSEASGYTSTAIGYAQAQGYGSMAINGGNQNRARATVDHTIQIGGGTNSTEYTLQITSYTLLDLNTGLIPPERLGTGYDATKTQVLKHVNGVLTWVEEA